MNNYKATGRLSRDPELRALPDGTPVCKITVAVKGLARGDDEVGYIDVTSFGAGGEAAARVLGKGWLVADRRAPAVPRLGDPGGRQAPWLGGHRQRRVPRRTERRGLAELRGARAGDGRRLASRATEGRPVRSRASLPACLEISMNLADTIMKQLAEQRASRAELSRAAVGDDAGRARGRDAAR